MVVLKIQSNFKNTELKVGEKAFMLIRNKWTTEILEDDKIVYHLKTNSFSGKTKVIETEQNIKGVWGPKWGTQLVDKENKTLLKIRNKNQFRNNNKYVIELSNEKVTDFDILLTLYGHLYGSSMKQKAVIGVIGIIISRILVQ